MGKLEIINGTVVRFRGGGNAVIPNGVKSIGDGAFRYRRGLTSVVIPDSVKSIGDDAFWDCRLLGSVVIPDGVKSIGKNAFLCCGGLRHVVIPDSVESIGDSAFRGCAKLADEDGFVIIRNMLFSYHGKGGDVSIPNGVTYICNQAFDSCSNLTSIVIPDSVKHIGAYAFDGCTGLTSVTIPDGVTSIEDGTFQNCSSLTSVVIPDSVTSIGKFAFGYCSSLTDVVISNGSINIDNSAFYHCSNLADINFPDESTMTGKSASGESGALKGNSDFVIENGVLRKYKGKDKTVIIPEGVTTIDTRAFEFNDRITDVVIPDGVTIIGFYAFYECSSLTSVVIPNSVTNIGNNPFHGSSDELEVHMTDLTTYMRLKIGHSHNLYINDELVTNAIIPDSVTSIRKHAFSDCSSLTSIVIPDSVTSIGSSAFSECKSLTNVIIPDSVTSIGSSAFSECKSLTNVIIPNSVTSIGEYAFAFMDALIIFNDPISDELKLSQNMFGIDVHILTKNISSMPAYFQAQAAVDFAEDERFKDVDRASYLKYIKSNAAKLIDKAMQHPALLSLMCSEKLITAKKLEAYTEAAQKTGNAELIAMMLDYSGKISEKDKEKVVKAKEKQDEEVFERMVQRQGKVSIEGLKFVVTGELKTFAKRDDLKVFIESKGAKLVGSMSSKVDYLIMNDKNSDSDKRKKCEEFGIEIIDEYKFNELAGRMFEIENGILKKYIGTVGDVVIPDGVTSIGYSAFSDCSSLTSVVIPDSVTSIGRGAFCYCSSLTSVVIPDGVTSIGNEAFRGCVKLADAKGFVIVRNVVHSYHGTDIDIVIPDGVTSIGERAFAGCSSLTSVVIPDSVTSIGENAFVLCSGLTSIVIPDSVMKIHTDAFWGCYELVIRAPKGSYAAKYAKKNYIKLEIN